MHTKTLEAYRTIRNGNENMQARWALQHAKDQLRFAKAEEAGLVRVVWVHDSTGCTMDDLLPDFESMTDRAKDHWCNRADRLGIWGLVGIYREAPTDQELDGCEDLRTLERLGWTVSDSIWGFMGQDDNGYLHDVQAATLVELRERLASRCKCCRK